ncbi:MAG: ligase-associated DNA damage response endonuclease PdeM [Alphaproteobacteria bacterium]|nr:ligase-associated DNA damage response endonuclease PdeM [Alphaproteobacteria bacterium]
MFAAAPRPRTDRRPLAFTVAGARLEAQACGALWWEDASVLVVSDLHLEKGSSHASRGQMLPPYDTRTTLARIAALMVALRPTTVISLGDSFHDRRARARMAPDDVARVRSMTAACDWVWIEGNHDPMAPEDLGGRAAMELVLGALTFRHEPTPGGRGEIAGHLHPCALVTGRGRAVRARCFASDGERLVMPAYGALTGGLNVLDPAFDRLFPNGLVVGAMGRDGVYAAAMERLAADGPR